MTKLSDAMKHRKTILMDRIAAAGGAADMKMPTHVGILVINFRCLSEAQDLMRLTFQFDVRFLTASITSLVGPINFFLYGIDCPNERREKETYVVFRYPFHMLD